METTKQILEILESCSAVCIFGESRVGKTTLLKTLESQLPNSVYLQLQSIFNVNDFVEYLADEINDKFGLNVSDKSLHSLTRDLKKIDFQLTILLDELGKFQNNPVEFNCLYGWLKSISEGKHRIVTASLRLHDNLDFNNCVPFELTKTR